MITGMMMKSKLDLFERNYKKEDAWFVLEDRQDGSQYVAKFRSQFVYNQAYNKF